MKKYFLYCIGLVIVFCGRREIALPQNLVTNWSFEEFNDSCSNPEYFDNVKDWYPKYYLQGGYSIYAYSTPDYYSSCMFFVSYKPPNIIFGYQEPYHLGSFVGLIYHGVNNGNHDREGIRIELKKSLKQGICYHAEMYVNFGNNSTYICDKLGMVLTTDSFAMKYDGTIPMSLPQIYTDLLINDTVNWTKIEGNFTAQGGEKWLTIGWFFPTTQINYFLIGDTTDTGIVTSAYYLIDAVQVYPCTDAEELIILPQFISPNGDGQNDFYIIDSLPPNSKATFFNRWGNEVYHSDNYQNDWDGKYLGHLLPVGTYFIVLQMPYGTRKTTYIELQY